MNHKYGSEQDDEKYIRLAIAEGLKALAYGDVPVGAVVVYQGQVIGVGHNQREMTCDPTAHAEIVAMRNACQYLGAWRLDQATLYSSLEPCPMCAAAMVQARLHCLVFAADDPKAGAAGSLLDLVRMPCFNHMVQVRRGVLAAEAEQPLRSFFAKLRSQGLQENI